MERVDRMAIKPYPPPPLSCPTPCPSPEGGGRRLVNTKIFVSAHCVVVWVTVL